MTLPTPSLNGHDMSESKVSNDCFTYKQFLAHVNDDEQIVVHSVVSMHGCYTAVHVFVPRGEQQLLEGRHYSRRVSCHINWWPQTHTHT